MPAETMKSTTAMPAPSLDQQQLPCPRCDSTNTKFCYYNNYNFSQPRHFCKSCRRYWTHGGTLRDIPVGGATRKNNHAKRSRILPPSPPQTFIKPPSFTSLLTSSSSGIPAGPPGFLAFGGLGIGIPNFEESGIGFGRPIWGFPEIGYGIPGGNGQVGGMMNMWQQMDLSDHAAGGFAAGDCLSWPDLAIGNGLK